MNNLANLENHVLPGTHNALRESIQHTQYLTHHVRWEPRASLGRIADVNLRFDGLRDVLWGDNAGLSQTALFAQTPSSTGLFGQDVPSIQLTTVFMRLQLGVLEIKVGRMPVHWGMGLLLNHGGNLLTHRAGIDDDFGDNHFPTIFDRFQVSSDVFQLYDFMRGRRDKTKKTNHELIAGYAFSRIVEEPFSTGYPMDMRRPYGDKTFLSRQASGVDEHVGMLLYRWRNFADGIPFVKKWGPNHVTAGLYFAYRRQRRMKNVIRLWDNESGRLIPHDCNWEIGIPECGTHSDLFIVDPYLNIRLGRLFDLEGEAYFVSGSVEPDAVAVGDDINRVRIHGWAVRATTRVLRPFNFKIEGGQASGDGTYDDNTFRERAMHPDHNVGLIMYSEFLRQRSASVRALAYPPPASVAPRMETYGGHTTGGVLNSFYFMPTASLEFMESFTMRLGVLTAWSHRQDGYFFPQNRGRHIGTEADLGFDIKWGMGDDTLRHMLLRLEAGYLLFGSQVRADYRSHGVFSLQARLAFVL